MKWFGHKSGAVLLLAGFVLGSGCVENHSLGKLAPAKADFPVGDTTESSLDSADLWDLGGSTTDGGNETALWPDLLAEVEDEEIPDVIKFADASGDTLPEAKDVPLDAGKPECVGPGDCESANGPAGACQVWKCNAGICGLNKQPQGSGCDDGDVCTVGDACDGAAGCAGTPDDCDDGDKCTSDSCTPGNGCIHEDEPPAPCADGDGYPGTMTCQNDEWSQCIVASPCELKINQWDTGTVNPYLFQAREGNFYVTYVAKENLDSGANLMLAWVDPTACQITAGPLAVNSTPGEVYYWGGQFAASDKVGNFYAAWEAGSGTGMEIAFAASESGTEFPSPIEMVSVSANGSDPSLAILAPGHVAGMWTGYISSNAPSGFEYDPFVAVNPSAFSGGGFGTATQVAETAIQDDQTAIVADSEGNLYAGWESFDDGSSEGGNIYVAKSDDGGATFGPKIRVNDVVSTAGVGKGEWLAFGDGNLYVVWADSRNDSEKDVYLDVAPGGTLAFGVDVLVNDNTYRYQEDPSVVVGQGGPCEGTVYVAWQDLRSNSSYDIYGARSTDAGLSFDSNIMLNPTEEGDQMNPSIGVDKSCAVGVACRDSATNNKFDIRAAFLPLW